MIRAFLTAAFVLGFPTVYAQPIALCQQISSLADSQATMAQPPLGHRVGGTERLYFHSAPFSSCAGEAFVVPGDHLTAYKHFDTWWFVIYTHPNTGEITEGWVKEIQLVYSGTMGLTE